MICVRLRWDNNPDGTGSKWYAPSMFAELAAEAERMNTREGTDRHWVESMKIEPL